MALTIGAAKAILLVFVACCSNVVLMEHLIQNDSGAGNLVTFLEYMFIVAEGFIFTTRCGRSSLRIPFKAYYPLVVMFFLVTVCSNYALQLSIPMPLYMVFSSGSLVVNMIMGMVILKNNYNWSKYLAVLLITIGIIVFTVISASDLKTETVSSVEAEVATISPTSFFAIFWWAVAVALMTISLVLSARVGIYQELIYKQYGKYPKDALFISHLLPMPGFALLYQNIIKHIAIASTSRPVTIPFLVGLTLPIQWLFLLGNVLTQFVCIRSVYALMSECSSLTVTLVLTLRRFASLLFSILYFRHSFGPLHWVGTIFVCFGTILFTDIVPKLSDSLTSYLESRRHPQVVVKKDL